MSDEASLILAMVDDGEISADEAAKLLKALNGQQSGGEEIRTTHFIKTMGEAGAGMHHALHGHLDGCHCVTVSSDEEVNILRERTNDV